MERKHLMFKDVSDPTKKTKAFEVISKYDNTVLARIHWYSNWRQYVMEKDGIIWSWDCLGDSSRFIKGLMDERKKPDKKEQAEYERNMEIIALGG